MLHLNTNNTIETELYIIDLKKLISEIILEENPKMNYADIILCSAPYEDAIKMIRKSEIYKIRKQMYTLEVNPRHRSTEFIEFLSLADNYYPADWRIRIILDNHSSHISKETMQRLKGKPNRFEFVYTPKHGSWLNLFEMFFSKMTRAFLRSLRVKSKDELKQRIEKYLDEVNAAPVIFKWTYKLDEVKV